MSFMELPLLLSYFRFYYTFMVSSDGGCIVYTIVINKHKSESRRLRFVVCVGVGMSGKRDNRGLIILMQVKCTDNRKIHSIESKSLKSDDQIVLYAFNSIHFVSISIAIGDCPVSSIQCNKSSSNEER